MADARSAGVSPIALHTSTPGELKERLAAERAGMPHLIYRDGVGNQVIRLLASSTGKLRIGRDRDCEISLEWDREVSGVHALLEMLGQRWAVEDGGLSLNGSFLNSERLHGRHRLRDGDELVVGQTTIVFREAHGSGGVTTRPGVKSSAATLVTEADRRVLVVLCRPMMLDPHALPATNKAIADQLCLSVPAVKKRMTALFRRFGLTHLGQSEKRTRLAVEALQQGIVSSRDV